MANTIDQENLWHLQLNYEVYYVTQECIQPGTELLVWYGSGYGSRLGLTRTTDDYMRRWNETKWKTHLVNPQLISKTGLFYSYYFVKMSVRFRLK